MHTTDWRGERLVELDEVEVVDADAGPIEGLARGRHGADAHHRRVDAGDGGRDDARHRRQTQGARPVRLDQEHGGRAVVDARAVARRDGPAASRNAGFSAARASADVSARGCSSRSTSVDIALSSGHLDRHDLAVEAAGLDRRDRALLALEREGILPLAADVPALGHVLGGLAHRVRVVHRREPRG